MKFLTETTVLAMVAACAFSAPLKSEDTRQMKSLAYYDYIQPNDALEYSPFETDEGDDYSLDYDQNDLSRSIPKRKKLRRPYNSPIYYIRLPPQPYMFVPGLGYVSQPPSNPMQQFLNVPVSFVSNGKPANIYQWSGIQQFPQAAPAPPPTPRPRPTPKPTDSTVHRLPGTFAFNGKPEDVYVLRDSYNSLYSDALQNFYP